jgi:hypothetical protein
VTSQYSYAFKGLLSQAIFRSGGKITKNNQLSREFVPPLLWKLMSLVITIVKLPELSSAQAYVHVYPFEHLRVPKLIHYMYYFLYARL